MEERQHWTVHSPTKKNYQTSSEGSKSQVQNKWKRFSRKRQWTHRRPHQTTLHMGVSVNSKWVWTRQAPGTWICWVLICRHSTKSSEKPPSQTKIKPGTASSMSAQLFSFPGHFFMVTAGKRMLQQKNPLSPYGHSYSQDRQIFSLNSRGAECTQ